MIGNFLLIKFLSDIHNVLFFFQSYILTHFNMYLKWFPQRPKPPPPMPPDAPVPNFKILKKKLLNKFKKNGLTSHE